MSQRDSGYERIGFDAYETPEWVTSALVPFVRGRIIPRQTIIHEPAAGSGRMVAALRRCGFFVTATDIMNGDDFLLATENYPAIITNPPYSHATVFIEHALALTKPVGGIVAMLLRADFDSAQTRNHLFNDCPAFSQKIVLLRRIKWFEKSEGQPSFNHAWYIWDHEHKGPPTLRYAK